MSSRAKLLFVIALRRNLQVRSYLYSSPRPPGVSLSFLLPFRTLHLSRLVLGTHPPKDVRDLTYCLGLNPELGITEPLDSHESPSLKPLVEKLLGSSLGKILVDIGGKKVELDLPENMPPVSSLIRSPNILCTTSELISETRS